MGWSDGWMVRWLPDPVKLWRENRFETICLLGYLAVASSLLYFHEPWRDELQCWAIAKESTSFFDLLFKARYEGHPSAWYAILFSITRFSDSFLLVRVCHLLLAMTVAFLILFKSPFSKIQKCLLVFGYFFIYEYSALSRNYSLGLLLFFLICILIKNRKKYWLTICGLLFLAMQVNVFSTLLACALFAVLFFEQLLFFKNKTQKDTVLQTKVIASNKGNVIYFSRQFIIGIFIFTAGLLLSALDMLPPVDSTFMPEWKWATPQWQQALSSFLHAMAPLPKINIHFWNTHILQGFVPWDWLLTVESVLAILLLTGCVISLRKHSLALAFFVMAWVTISVFISVKYVGFLRHHGHFFIAYIMAFWIKKDGISFQKLKLPNNIFSETIFLNTLFLIHIIAAVTAVYFDTKHPFTQSHQSAHYIEKNYPVDTFIAGHFDYATSPVSFHLKRPLFYPNQNKKGTFIYWSGDRFEQEVTDIRKATGTICGENRAFLLLTSYPLSQDPASVTTIVLVKNFAPAVVKEEEYWLYQVTCPSTQSSQSRSIE